MRIFHFSSRILVILISFCFSQFVFSVQQFCAINSLDTLYLSSDSGLTWTNLEILKSLNKSTYLTASARNEKKPDLIAVGTSFEGIFESTDAGKTWKSLEAIKTFKPYFQGGGFYDEVLSLAYAPDDSNDIFFRLGFNGKAFRYIRATKKVVEIDPAAPAFAFLPLGFRFNYDFSNLEPQPGLSLPPIEAGITLPAGFQNGIVAPPADPNREKRRLLADNKHGFYLNPRQAHGENLIQQLDFAVKNKLNSIVVDFKDDQGFLTYDSEVLIAKENKAILKRIDVSALIAAAHARGIYVIARIVVFKDKQLFRYNKNAYAIWNRVSKKPWGVFRQETVPPAKAGAPATSEWVQTEYWVDPYSDQVHQYNIDIAKEAQALGADEIQFDYIRFPSDGDSTTVLCRFHKDDKGEQISDETNGQARIKALCEFLRKAREALTIPIGTDVFGFNGWARMSYLGQDIQAISYYVDVISPMMYPSHYSMDFLPWMKYLDRASYIYETGTDRARIICNNRALIRPYVQAFLIGGETKWDDPIFYDYLNRQIKGLIKGNASGFTLWNNSGRYYMVEPGTFSGLFSQK